MRRPSPKIRRRLVSAALALVMVGLAGFTGWAMLSALDEAEASRRAAEATAADALAALDVEQARAMAEADRLARQIDDLAGALDQVRGTNATLASDVDRLVTLTVDQSAELDNLRGRVAQLSAAIVELGGQIPGPRAQSQPEPEPECEGPPGHCRQENQ